MTYHLHLTEAQLLAVREGLTTRLYELDELRAETLRNPDGYTNDLLRLYEKKQKDMRKVLEKITLAEES